MSTITVRRWTLQEWLSSEAVWQALLARTDADALFLSWQWLTRWWTLYGDRLGLSADIMAFYRDTELVGVAPLYVRDVRRASIVRTRSVQIIGHAWRDAVPLISEYLDVVAVPDAQRAVRDACMREVLQQRRWGEFVVGLTAAGADWRDTFLRHAPPRHHYVRELDRGVSYQANLAQGFAAYLQELGQSTRRSVWNLRRRLVQESGAVQFEPWGRKRSTAASMISIACTSCAGSGRRSPASVWSFTRVLPAHLAAHGEFAFTRLRVAGNVVSVLYDIRKGARQYNIKMGFDPALNNRLSLGLIHFGYAMEAAAERGITVYDFLAGAGRNYDFKPNLAQGRRELSCVQMLRGSIMPLLYRSRDRVR